MTKRGQYPLWEFCLVIKMKLCDAVRSTLSVLKLCQLYILFVSKMCVQCLFSEWDDLLPALETSLLLTRIQEITSISVTEMKGLSHMLWYTLTLVAKK